MYDDDDGDDDADDDADADDDGDDDDIFQDCFIHLLKVIRGVEQLIWRCCRCGPTQRQFCRRMMM